MSIIFSLSLYFTSFAPLWFSVLFVDLKSIIDGGDYLKTEWISIICILLLFIVCTFVLMVSLKTVSISGSETYRLIVAKEQKAITSEYLLSYILPLFAFDFTKWDQVVLFLIFFGVLGYLCVKHNYFSVNIILEFARFKFYECRLVNDDGVEIQSLLLSDRKLNSLHGHDISLKPINNEIKLDIAVR